MVGLEDFAAADQVAVFIEVLAASIRDLAAASDTDSPVGPIIACGDEGGLGGVMGQDLSPMPIPITPMTVATLPITRTPIPIMTTSAPIMTCRIPIMMEVIGNAGGVRTAMGVQTATLEKGGGRARYARREAVSSESRDRESHAE
jgi:hypothetical protein